MRKNNFELFRYLAFRSLIYLLSYLVIEGNQNGRRHVQFRGGDLCQILASVEIDQPLGVLGEAGHQEELVIIGPDDSGPLLGDDVTPLLQRLCALAGVIDPVSDIK